jgi:ligand-binding sensor domain-containing protein
MVKSLNEEENHLYGKKRALALLILPLIVILIISAMLLLKKGSFSDTDLTGSVLNEADVPEGWKRLCLENEFSAIFEQGDVIWAGGRDGLFKFDKKSVEFAGKLELVPNLTYVRGLVTDDENRLFIASQDGLVIYEDGKSSLITTKDGLPDNRVNCIMKDKEGAIWVGTWEGAAVYRDGKWEALKTEDGLCSNMVNVMLQDSSGGLWFGAYAVRDGGVSCLKDGNWYHFNLSNGLPNENVTAFYEDTNSDIWCGTGFLYKGGACRFVYKEDKPVMENILMKSDGLAGEKVRSIFEDGTGNVWFCSEYDGAVLFKNDKSLILNVKDGLSDPEIKAGITDKQGNLWLATRSGVTYISREALEKLKDRN